MARIYFQYDPNDPESYQREKTKAIFRTVVGIFLLIGIWYVLAVFAGGVLLLLHGEFDWIQLKALGIVTLLGLLIFYVYTDSGLSRKLVAPRFAACYIGILLIICGILALISSIEKAPILMAGSIAWIIAIIIGMILFIKKSKEKDDERILAILEKEEQKRLDKEERELASLLKQEEQKKKKEEREREKEARKFKQSINLDNQKDNKKSIDPDCIYCRKCGKKLPSDSVFCSSCGTRIE